VKLLVIIHSDWQLEQAGGLVTESGTNNGPIEDVSEDFSEMNRGQGCTNRIERIRRQETPLTELEAELEAEKGHSTLTNENKILRKKACLSSLKS
jgi:hypothetical protein